MIARIGIQAGHLAIGAKRHRQKELDTVRLAGLRQDHDAIEKPVGALFGGHLGDVGSRELGAGGRLLRCRLGLPPCSAHRDDRDEST